MRRDLGKPSAPAKRAKSGLRLTGNRGEPNVRLELQKRSNKGIRVSLVRGSNIKDIVGI